MTAPCRTCGCPREMHVHDHYGTYCGRKVHEDKSTDRCNCYKPPRQWWQFWRRA